MKKGLFRICGLFLCLALILSCLTACGGSNSTNSGSSVTAAGAKWQDDKIELYVIASGTPRIFTKVIQDYALDKKYGLEINYHEGTGVWGAEWNALQTGTVNCANVDYMGMIQHKDQVATVAVAANLGWLNGLVVKKDSKLLVYGQDGKVDKAATIARINFKTKLGTYATYSPDWYVFKALHSVLTNGGDFPDAITSDVATLNQYLENGSFEAIWSYGDTNFVLDSSKYVIVATANEMYTILADKGQKVNGEAPCVYYSFAKSFYDQYPDTCQKFVMAVYDAYDILMSDDAQYKDLWKKLAVSCYGVSQDNLSDELVESLKTNIRKYLVCENTKDTYSQVYQQVEWLANYIGQGYENVLGFPTTAVTNDMFAYYKKN